MSHISVNDHLEGILSDFEALKRSFDVDDVDELPPFSPSSPVPSPLSSTSLLNKTNEGRGFPTSNHGSPAFRSRISLGTNPSPAQSPVFKSRMVSSLSFNRATNRPTINNNGGSSGGITRASSFQNKFNPKGFSSSLSGPGSDNDSLHSSSSSLDYSIQGGGGEGGGGVTLGKPGSLSYSTSPQMEQRPGQQPGSLSYSTSPQMEQRPGQQPGSLSYSTSPQMEQQPGSLSYSTSPQMEQRHGQQPGSLSYSTSPQMEQRHGQQPGSLSYSTSPQMEQRHGQQPGSLSYSTSPQMEQPPGLQRGLGLGMGKKFSSHGSVFHSELEGPMGLGAPEPRGVSHGSMPSLDLQIGEGGGGVMGVRGAGGGGVRYGNANVGLNGGSQRHYNTSPFGKEGCYSPNQNHNSYQAQPKPKETQRLNKFPLDLDSLVGVKTLQPSPHPPPSSDPPKPPPRAHYPSSLSVSASPSLSSLDSSGGDLTPLPAAKHHVSYNNINPSLPRSPPPTSPPGAKPVPKVSQSPVPLSPAQTPQLNLLSPRPQVGHLAPSTPLSLEHTQPQDMMSERESVGSILQRIASFSSPDAITTTRFPSAASVLSGVALSNGVKKESPPPMMMMHQERVSSPLPVAVQRQGLKRVQDTTKVLEQEIPASMEERGMEEVKPSAVEDKAAAEEAVEERVAQEKTEDSTAQNKETEEREMEGEVEVVTPCPTENHGLQGTIKGHDLFGYVGIEAVLDQMRRKTMKAGFEFNIMVVGDYRVHST
ncbi:histone acetyltransferase p300-like [Oncorhynchus masou masou]|uniref:histone acetyltransferase p300-like n=1 Tax=Oncorhynchus masou masou TaxID=90313 RepID=UPI00318440DE